MNALAPLVLKFRKIAAVRIAALLGRPATRRRRREEQLEFPWRADR